MKLNLSEALWLAAKMLQKIRDGGSFSVEEYNENLWNIEQAHDQFFGPPFLTEKQYDYKLSQ